MVKLISRRNGKKDLVEYSINLEEARPTEAPGKDILHPDELPADCAVCSGFPASVSCHPCWGGL